MNFSPHELGKVIISCVKKDAIAFSGFWNPYEKNQLTESYNIDLEQSDKLKNCCFPIVERIEKMFNSFSDEKVAFRIDIKNQLEEKPTFGCCLDERTYIDYEEETYYWHPKDLLDLIMFYIFVENNDNINKLYSNEFGVDDFNDFFSESCVHGVGIKYNVEISNGNYKFSLEFLRACEDCGCEEIYCSCPSSDEEDEEDECDDCGFCVSDCQCCVHCNDYPCICNDEEEEEEEDYDE
jgi:hypothetical protein